MRARCAERANAGQRSQRCRAISAIEGGGSPGAFLRGQNQMILAIHGAANTIGRRSQIHHGVTVAIG
jgi:hypothetical protein